MVHQNFPPPNISRVWYMQCIGIIVKHVLLLTDPPTISSLSPANITVAVDMDHMIQCTFEGLPTPTVVWSHDGNVLTDGSNDITITTGNTSSTLTVTMVTTDDSGNYTCMAFNFLGSATASSLLHIQGMWIC